MARQSEKLYLVTVTETSSEANKTNDRKIILTRRLSRAQAIWHEFKPSEKTVRLNWYVLDFENVDPDRPGEFPIQPQETKDFT